MTKLEKTLNKARGSFASFTTHKGTFAGRVKAIGKTFVTLNIPYLAKPIMRVSREKIDSIRQGGRTQYTR